MIMVNQNLDDDDDGDDDDDDDDDGQESPMLHIKFRGNRPAGSVEEDF